MEDKDSAPFLTRVAYEEALSKGIAHQFFVPTEQQADQQRHLEAGPTILQESVPEANPTSHDCANLPIH